MAAPLPTINGGYSAPYPVTRQISFDTSISTFKNGSEQRFQRQAGRAAFSLQFTGLDLADRNAIETWFQGSAGAIGLFTFYFLANPGVPLANSAPYGNLSLSDNQLTISEDFLGQFSVALQCSATTTQWTGTQLTPVAFPTFANGLTAQYPFRRGVRQLAYISRMSSGPIWTFPQFGAGLAGFPTRGLFRWSWGAVLTDADLLTLETFFIDCAGRYGEFSFIDPYNGASFPRCRFDTDALAINHVGVNQSAVQIAIAELF